MQSEPDEANVVQNILPYSPPNDTHSEHLEKQRKRVEDQIKKSQQTTGEGRQPITRNFFGQPQNIRQDLMKEPEAEPTNLLEQIMTGMDKTLGILQYNQESRLNKSPMQKQQVNKAKIGENDNQSPEPQLKDSQEEWLECLQTYFSTFCAYYTKIDGF